MGRKMSKLSFPDLTRPRRYTLKPSTRYLNPVRLKLEITSVKTRLDLSEVHVHVSVSRCGWRGSSFLFNWRYLGGNIMYFFPSVYSSLSVVRRTVGKVLSRVGCLLVITSSFTDIQTLKSLNSLLFEFSGT